MIAPRKGSKKGTLYMIRRVPKRYEPVEPERRLLWINLNTDSMSAAKAKAEIVWQGMVESWEAKLAGDTDDAEQRLDAAKRLAASRSLRFLKAEDVARLPLREIVDRAKMAEGREGKPDRVEARAVLGGAEEPKITVSKALDEYWTLSREQTLGKSPDQLRRWRNPRMKAVKNLIDVIGDKALDEITGGDTLDFRAWWLDRIENEGVNPQTANKDLIHLGGVLKLVNRMKRLGLVLPLSDLSFKKGEKVRREPFSRAWIEEKILAPGALDGLNLEARTILKVMINTGARPSEIANLRPDHVQLDANIPHISIEPTKERHLKTENARRKIPLLGASLEAMRACPKGFPRYVDKPGLSATVNKYMRANGLMETPAHTLYGLRHSFEDRMLAADIDERIRRDILGHALRRERYGKGGELEHVQRLLQPVAL